MSRLDVHLLGAPRVEANGEPVHIGRRKSVALLAYLAMSDAPQSRDALATLLWPGYDQSRARGHLRRALYSLSKALGPDWLATEHETVALNPYAGAWIDVAEFRQRLAACASHADGHLPDAACPECQSLLTEAEELYRDDFLAGFTLPDSPAFDEWQRYHTEGLRDELAGALERLAGVLGTEGEYEQAIAHARRSLELDPLHEPGHRCLMELYARAGRKPAALRQYRECLRALDSELGIPPSEETTAVYERLRAERAAPAESEEPARMPSRVQLPAFLRDEAQRARAAEQPVFVARERELERLFRHLDAALVGQGKVVFVTGGPGRGKTALMGEFARQAMAAYPDLLVANGACNAYSGVGDPYLPFREALAMLTGDVGARWAAGVISREHARRLWSALPLAAQTLMERGPHLVDVLLAGRTLYARAAAAAPSTPAWLGQLQAWVERDKEHRDLEQAALFEQFTNVLAALATRHPLLLTLDDLQWTDAGSAGLLFHVGRRLEAQRILVVGAYRPEEVAPTHDGRPHALQELLTEFKRLFGEVTLDLAQADAAAGRHFVDSVLDTEPNRLGADFRSALHQHTGGHPLFTVELLRAMQERAELIRDADADGAWVEGATLDWGVLPARVEAVIEKRLERIDRELRDLLAVASVEGERFTAQVVAQVHGMPERDALRVLSQGLAARHRLVRESEALQMDGRFLFRYQFAHALFQEYLYSHLSTSERLLLHGEVGAVLEGLYGEQAEEIASDLAHHFDAAGRREQAAEYTLIAADQARRAYANDEAIKHYRRALELVPVASAEQDAASQRLSALTGLGRVHFEVGNLEESERCFRAAIALGKEMGLAPLALVRIYPRLITVLRFQGRGGERLRVAEEGLALLENEGLAAKAASPSAAVGSTEAASMYSRLWRIYEEGGNRARSIEFVDRCRRLAPRVPRTPRFRGVFLNLAETSWLGKDTVGAGHWLEVLNEIGASFLHTSTIATVRRKTAELRQRQGDLRGAFMCTQEARELYAKIGNEKNVAGCFLFAGLALLQLGEINGARECLLQSLHHANATGSNAYLLDIYAFMGVTSLCRCEWDDAADALSCSLETHSNQGWWLAKAIAHLWQGFASAARGQHDQAIDSFQNALARAPAVGRFSDPLLVVACALSGLEEAFDDPEAFHGFCRKFRDKHPQRGDWGIANWYLVPPEPRGPEHNLVSDHFEGPSFDWDWHDPFDDCSYVLEHGLDLHATNGRDLWHINLSAPRLLRPAPPKQNWVAQTVCAPISDERPAIGGLLLWKDKENYLRLDVGTRGADEISFQGCLGNEDMIYGRGRLGGGRPVDGEPGASGVWLRTERVGDAVRALCSADGEEWFTAGSAEFPFADEDTLQIGLHAIGNIDRSIYHGPFPEGTAIRFQSFEMWE